MKNGKTITMKNISTFILTISVLSLLAGCKPSDRLQVTRADALPDEEVSSRIYYALPRTVFRISVEYYRESFIPGPYRDYAEKYLGITGVGMSPSEQYSISDVELLPMRETDPSFLFAVNVFSGSFDPAGLLTLSSEGLIMDGNKASTGAFVSPEENGLHMPAFTDLTIKHNILEKEETMYKTIVTDSGYMRVPLLRTQIEQKTLEKKAEEAAAFITKLRKRRFKLISGQYEVFPEGVAMTEAIRKLDETEAEYLSLFVGKTSKQYYSREFWFIPEGKPEGESLLLGNFSDASGWLDGTVGEGKSLLVETHPSQDTRVIREAELPDDESTEESRGKEEGNFNLLYYRIPEMTGLVIRLGDTELLKARMPVEQYGKLVSIPVK